MSNLILMCIFWTASSFNYYLIVFFLKYIPGNIYGNTAISNGSELTAYIVSGYIMNLLGIKASYLIGFSVAAAGGLLLTFFFNMTSVIPVFVLLAKFGVAVSFNICYLAMPQLFPVALTGTAFGICNLFARFSTVLSAPVAELTEPLPTLVFTFLSIVPGLLSLLLK